MFTSAGFFWLQAGVPGLLPYLLVEQNDVEGPEEKDEEGSDVARHQRPKTYTS